MRWDISCGCNITVPWFFFSKTSLGSFFGRFLFFFVGGVGLVLQPMVWVGGLGFWGYP